MRAVILALALTTCAPAPDSGFAGCFEATPDGRTAYRPDWAPNARGMCPTRREMVAAQEYADKARVIECRTGCRLGMALLLLRVR